MNRKLLNPGERVVHQEFGTGVVIEAPIEGYIRVLFNDNEFRVPVKSVQLQLSKTNRTLQSVQGTMDRLKKVKLSYEAHSIPLMENAAVLTSAPIDLLPHQIVLTHSIALASPRRFLIADEVGLGKTIETALILRELASRGELKRALMVVPAGLVNNWQIELNEVFKLDFEVFGSQGDITDRRTNAFAKHDRLIASIDTLKKTARIERILQAPSWDLIVVDEAHHLSAHKSSGKMRKTENYKLGESLKDHTRDLIFLSATPHQGDHFQFWMLIQLLNPTLFSNPKEMVDQRHRLNSLMFRRTKADACRSNGEPLFARRQVYTESFVMSKEEAVFYGRLREYLTEGFDIAKRQDKKARALGFIMAVFQKIAASSFYAVQNTLRHRLLVLTLREAHIRDRQSNLEERDKLYGEARELVAQKLRQTKENFDKLEVDHILDEQKYKVAKKLNDELSVSEIELLNNNDNVENSVSFGAYSYIPEERLRITELLEKFPVSRETKIQKLLDAIGTLWRKNPNEKIVIFTTYLGTVELLQREIHKEYPGQGVVVLRGGDHSMKIAAVRRFSMKDGPKVLICTTAGREGINLQFSRILFNFDMPWNPMDLEQRIGRIHRYGQEHTAQIYNLVLSDTIEGRIYLLLDDKLKKISRTLGKVDYQGNIEENLKIQILGQLSEKLNYDRLFQEALSDPELKRTEHELEIALSNAKEAREVVFELFQDLDKFRFDDYKPLPNLESCMNRMVEFIESALETKNSVLKKLDQNTIEIEFSKSKIKKFTLNRDVANSNKNIELLGLDHPIVSREIDYWSNLNPEKLGVSISGNLSDTVLLTLWKIEISKQKGERTRVIIPIAIDLNGNRIKKIEDNFEEVFKASPIEPKLSYDERHEKLNNYIEPMLQRELYHKELINDGSYSSTLIAYIEIA